MKPRILCVLAHWYPGSSACVLAERSAIQCILTP
jgi:hypothetical protein